MTAFPTCSSLLSMSVQSQCLHALINHSVIETVISHAHRSCITSISPSGWIYPSFTPDRAWWKLENLTFHCLLSLESMNTEQQTTPSLKCYLENSDLQILKRIQVQFTQALLIFDNIKLQSTYKPQEGINIHILRMLILGLTNTQEPISEYCVTWPSLKRAVI